MNSKNDSVLCRKLTELEHISGAVILVIVLFLSFTLNSLVIILILHERKRKSKTSLYLSYYGLFMLLITTCIILDVIDFWLQGWVAGDLMCRISEFFLELSIMASTCVLLWISLDRYMNVFKVGAYRKFFDNVHFNVLSSCVVVGLFSVPFALIYHKTVDSCGRTVCRSDFHGKMYPRIAFTLESILVYAIPVVLMGVLYAEIFIFVLNSENKSGNDVVTPSTGKTNATPTPVGASDSRERVASPIHESGENNQFHQPVVARTHTVIHKVSAIYHGISRSTVKITNSLMSIFLVFGFFVFTWTPFIMVRLLRTFPLDSGEQAWRISQFLWLFNISTYPFMYFVTNRKLRSAAFRLIKKL